MLSGSLDPNMGIESKWQQSKFTQTQLCDQWHCHTTRHLEGGLVPQAAQKQFICFSNSSFVQSLYGELYMNFWLSECEFATKQMETNVWESRRNALSQGAYLKLFLHYCLHLLGADISNTSYSIIFSHKDIFLLTKNASNAFQRWHQPNIHKAMMKVEFTFHLEWLLSGWALVRVRLTAEPTGALRDNVNKLLL